MRGKERGYGGSRTAVGVSRNDCGEVPSKSAPSPAACLRQAGERAAPGNSTAFVWVVRKGAPPANKDQLKLWTEAPAETLRSFWPRRFYDFNVWSAKKRIEKLNYMDPNRLKRGLVAEPGLWAWSSYRFYQHGEKSVCTPDREPK